MSKNIFEELVNKDNSFPVWWQATMDRLEELILVTDTTGNIRYVNRAFQVTFGYSLNDLLGKHPDVFVVNPPNSGAMKASILKMRNGDGVEFNLMVQTKQGYRIEASVYISAFGVVSSDITHYICIARDLSRERTLQKQLHELQRMDAIGRLAKGVAHRFNHVLSVIEGQTQLMDVRGSADAFTQERMNSILAEVAEGRDTVILMKTFLREQSVHANPVEVNGLLRQMVRFCEKILPPDVTFKYTLLDDHVYVMGVSEEINQIVLNLLNNAFEALPETGGEVSLTLTTVDEALISRQGKSQPCMRLRIADDGCGITAVDEKHIFDPFFTTKHKRCSAGMGLTVVKAMIERYRGEIRFYSAPGQGAVFEVYLPLHIPEFEADKDLFGPCGQGERILLVDDEAFVLESGGALLRNLGYTVVTSSQREDFEKLIKNEKFDLLILDMSLYGGSGLAYIKQMHSDGVQLPPIVLTTSYDLMPQLWETSGLGIQRVLSKPCPTRELSEAIHRILTGRLKS